MVDNYEVPLFFRGSEGFKKILEDTRLSRPGRAIRVYNYGRNSREEDLYVIGTDKQLFDSKTGEKLEPEKALNMESAPDGWSVENFALHLLPESEIIKLLALPKDKLDALLGS